MLWRSRCRNFRLRTCLLGRAVSDYALGMENRDSANGTLDHRALEYVAMMREKSDNPVIKKSAEMAIAALKKLGKSCGNASAC